jgi:hypothetical protein
MPCTKGPVELLKSCITLGTTHHQLLWRTCGDRLDNLQNTRRLNGSLRRTTGLRWFFPVSSPYRDQVNVRRRVPDDPCYVVTLGLQGRCRACGGRPQFLQNTRRLNGSLRRTTGLRWFFPVSEPEGALYKGPRWITEILHNFRDDTPSITLKDMWGQAWQLTEHS